jgi:hypothetical protein
MSLKNFPNGTHTKTASTGIFKEVKLNRGRAAALNLITWFEA